MRNRVYWKNMSLGRIIEYIPSIGLVKERWKSIPGFENYYKASTFGRIKRLKRIWPSNTGPRTRPEEIVSQTKNPWGYLYVELDNGFGLKRKVFAHVLVAKTFVKNPFNKPQVNHKWGVKCDNRPSELEWATHSENQLHAYRIGLKKANKTGLGKKYELSSHSIPINQLTLDGVFIKRWSSQREAADKLGLSQGNIWSAINGVYKSTGGYKWEYAKEMKNENTCKISI